MKLKFYDRNDNLVLEICSNDQENLKEEQANKDVFDEILQVQYLKQEERIVGTYMQRKTNGV